MALFKRNSPLLCVDDNQATHLAISTHPDYYLMPLRFPSAASSCCQVVEEEMDGLFAASRQLISQLKPCTHLMEESHA
jgi:hypothetical protein